MKLSITNQDVIKFHSGNWQSLLQIFLFFLLDTLSIPPVLNKTAQLILPIHFAVCKTFLVPMLNLVNKLKGKVLVAAPLWTTIVVS